MKGYYLLLFTLAILAPSLVLGTVEQELAKRNGDFALDMYKELAKERDGNIFLSPMSISMALAMVYLGAQGNTQVEMAETLKFKDFQQLHDTFKLLSNVLKGTDDYDLEIANRLYSKEQFQPLSTYLEDTTNFYGAGLEKLDFIGDAEGSRTTINGWVEGKTRDKIKDLLPRGSINQDTVLILINAIYFKGAWDLPFNKTLTEPGNFLQDTCANPVELPMMTMPKKTRFNYYNSTQLKATLLAMPYEGDQLEMVVILPEANDGLSNLESTITIDNLHEALDEMVSTKITKIKIPQFKLSQTEMLVDLFKKLGISDLFDPSRADLSGIGEDLFVSGIVHKAFIEVNEEGTEAAAGTGITVETTSYTPPINFIADHPFMFLIREKSTGSILFLGRLNEAPAGEGDEAGENLCTDTASGVLPSLVILTIFLLFGIIM